MRIKTLMGTIINVDRIKRIVVLWYLSTEMVQGQLP